MIKVSIHRDDMMAQIIVGGHARYAEPGQDIVCAAVSTITHLLASMAEAWRDDLPTMHSLVTVDGDDTAPWHIFIDSSGNAAVDAAVDCIIDAYQQIAEQYPENVQVNMI